MCETETVYLSSPFPCKLQSQYETAYPINDSFDFNPKHMNFEITGLRRKPMFLSIFFRHSWRQHHVRCHSKFMQDNSYESWSHWLVFCNASKFSSMFMFCYIDARKHDLKIPQIVLRTIEIGKIFSKSSSTPNAESPCMHMRTKRL